MTPKEFVSEKDKRGLPLYLPYFLRDFHDQKRIFKRIHEFVANKKRKGGFYGEPYTYLDDVTWVAAHVYVIDFFLWFMAQHGYTLQKSRRPIEFHDIDAEMKDFEERQLVAYCAELDARFSEREKEQEVKT